MILPLLMSLPYQALIWSLALIGVAVLCIDALRRVCRRGPPPDSML